jgi:hypothetical protein
MLSCHISICKDWHDQGGKSLLTTSNTADAATKQATPSAKSLDPIHDAAQQARNLRQVLQDDKQRIGCFLGAGCPLGIYDAEGQKSVVLIPAIIELTRRIAEGWKLRTVQKAPPRSTKSTGIRCAQSAR